MRVNLIIGFFTVIAICYGEPLLVPNSAPVPPCEDNYDTNGLVNLTDLTLLNETKVITFDLSYFIKQTDEIICFTEHVLGKDDSCSNIVTGSRTLDKKTVTITLTKSDPSVLKCIIAIFVQTSLTPTPAPSNTVKECDGTDDLTGLTKFTDTFISDDTTKEKTIDLSYFIDKKDSINCFKATAIDATATPCLITVTVTKDNKLITLSVTEKGCEYNIDIFVKIKHAVAQSPTTTTSDSSDLTSNLNSSNTPDVSPTSDSSQTSDSSNTSDSSKTSGPSVTSPPPSGKTPECVPNLLGVCSFQPGLTATSIVLAISLICYFL